MKSLFYWAALVALILLFGLAQRATAQDDRCGWVFDTARAGYVASAAGVRPSDMIARVTDRLPQAYSDLITAIILDAYRQPTLSYGIHPTWDRDIEQRAARYASDWEAACLVAARD